MEQNIKATKKQDDKRLYGRRNGRSLRLSQRQMMMDLLPKISIFEQRDDIYQAASAGFKPQQFFEKRYTHFHLEIGFGGGEHLAWQAHERPDTGFIGVEFYANGIASFLTHYQQKKINNCLLYQGDGREVVRILAESSLDRVYVLFPDPWRKKRHYSRRILQADFINDLARILKPGGELRIGTDDPSYQLWVMAHLFDHPLLCWQAETMADWKIRPQDWPPTRYEQKAIKEGRMPAYLRFINQKQNDI